jgi:hypothetical protein
MFWRPEADVRCCVAKLDTLLKVHSHRPNRWPCLYDQWFQITNGFRQGRTRHDQAGPQVATSAPVIPDDSFSFSAFVKQENPAEIAKAAMPTEQLSPEDIPGSGMSVGESGLPDAGRGRGQRRAEQRACCASRRSRPLITP